MTLRSFALAKLRIEALNHALEGLPPERTHIISAGVVGRGARVDVPVPRTYVDLVPGENRRPDFEAANPRHEHEWKIWKDVKLPAWEVLMPASSRIRRNCGASRALR